MARPDFSIITPSFNQLEYLRRCHASIMDQKGVTLEHIVADGGSEDGTAEWLRSRSDVVAIIGPDRGMYDAVNKGLDVASGRFIAYLNCDEQYLPGALQSVRRAFDDRASVDVVYGDVLIVNPDGTLLAYRKTYPPFAALIVTSHLYLWSAALFWHREIVDSGLRFSDEFRDQGDVRFVLDLIDRECRFQHVPEYLAAFTYSGQNMSLGKNATLEKRRIRQEAGWLTRALTAPLNAARFAMKVGYGCYRQSLPIRYSLYRPQAQSRCDIVAEFASYRWPG